MPQSLSLGVLTFHRCINYGSYWQARCLVGGLRSLGAQAEILDHRSDRVNRAEWRVAMRPVLPAPVPRPDWKLYREKMERFFEAFTELPLTNPFPLERPHMAPATECVVVGSDEVWNFSHPWYGNCPLFFGRGLKTQHLVAYGASFGHYGHGWGMDEPWSGWLRHFDSVSVRDENSHQLLRESVGLEAELVLDPCLLFDPVPRGDAEIFEAPYLAVYGHNFTPWFIAQVTSWARAHGLPLVSIGYRNDWADCQWLEAGPHEFAAFMAAAQCVATNFFHGCVFALRKERPFVCETTPYRLHKIEGLMAGTRAQGRLVTEKSVPADFHAALGRALEPEILNHLAELRRNSLQFLKGAVLANTAPVS